MSEMNTTGLWSDGGAITMRRSQDVEPYLQEAAAMRQAGRTGKEVFTHAAKIPFAFVEAYLAHAGIDLHEFSVNPVHIQRMCNDPALSKLRTTYLGRV